jgi:hypothetical protein
MRKAWQERLTYATLSTILGWHTFVMVVAPAPANDLTRSAQTILGPYVALYQLKHPWGFFAPAIGLGYELRYTIKDTSGIGQSFLPAKGVNAYHPASWWYSEWQNKVIAYPEIYAERMLEILCHQHQTLHPVSIKLFMINQLPFSRADFLAGKRPMQMDEGHEIAIAEASCS